MTYCSIQIELCGGLPKSQLIVRCLSNHLFVLYLTLEGGAPSSSWHGPAFGRSDMKFMKTYSHPVVRKVPLEQVMYALSDPCRIAIVRALAAANGRELACNEIDLKISKATRSHHFDVLRDSGIVFSRYEGTRCLTSLRTAELNQSFPGLLDLVLSRERPRSRSQKRQRAVPAY
jgi:DNA-binding transcriptional ArsR family regulator